MGIYGALSTAVTGLQAQAFALQNISGNIANSQTIGFKRVETSFEDLVPDGSPTQQTAGSVIANSRATNTVQGDISTSQVATNMAINGSGFFVVQQRSGQSDGGALFSGANYYTRRGDFTLDKEGYLVNGASNYLEGLPIDAATGNVSGSVPSVIKVSNALLPALATTQVDYQINLPQTPQDGAYQSGVVGSELLKAGDFLPPASVSAATETGTVNLNNDTPATSLGATDITGSLATAGITNGEGLSITIGGVTKTIAFNNTGTPGSSDAAVDLTTGTGADLVTAINTAFGGTVASLDSTTGALKLTAANNTDSITVADDPAATAGALTTLGGLAAGAPSSSVISGLGHNLSIQIGSNAAVPVSLTGVADAAGLLSAVQAAVGAHGTASIDPTTGKLTITAANTTDSITLSGADATTMGLSTSTVNPATVPGSGTVSTVSGANGDAFLNESISGGAITIYGANGAPVNVQLRWAKTDSAATGGTDTWNLYYMSNSAATGSQTMWTNVGVNYTFDSSGALSPPVTSTTVNNLTVDGTNVGSIKLQHGAGGITQFADANGASSVTTLTQNGYAAGKFTSVAVDNSGRVVASYSNGQQINVAQVVLANFNGADFLKRLDGGTFAETTDSGSPVLVTNPSISGSSLESSNTDISSEFSNLIVTQQAYAAGAKIVTSANDMLQQALNMIR
ncbi:MAG: flagellar hook-basal body complex protein [Devosia sp.]|nr:flagellar hook-basal body complex protein [Devosia sp.]